MYAAASEEQWSAIRDLRECLRPTYRRLSRASGINISTIAKRAQAHHWRSPDERPDDAREDRGGYAPDGGQASDAGRDCVGMGLAAGHHGDGLGGPEAQIADMLKRQAARMLAVAEAQGKILDKAQIDTMSSIVRLVERQKTLAPERAEDKNTGDDVDPGELHRRIDRRILELAIAAARWMVATRDPRILG